MRRAGNEGEREERERERTEREREERERTDRRARQLEYLASLAERVDLEILASHEMWR